jgi:hypothetical protein
MNAYRTVSLGLSVLNNVQTFQANRKLDSLLDAQANEARKAEIRDHALDQILRFEGLLNRQASAAAHYWNALLFFRWQRTNGITSAALPHIAEKERFVMCESLARQRLCDAKAALSDESIKDLDQGRVAMDLIPVINSYRIWKEIQRRMGANPLLRIQLWSGMPNSIVAFNVGLIAFFIVGIIGSALTSPNVPNWVAGIALVAGFIVGRFAVGYREKQAATFNQMASRVGGFFTPRAKYKEAKVIVSNLEMALQDAGISPATLISSNEIAASYYSQAAHVNTTYSLGLQIPALLE